MAKKVGLILDHPDLTEGRIAGLGRYASMLVEGLGHRPEVKLKAIHRARARLPPFGLEELVPRKAEALSMRVGAWYIGLPAALRGADLDIVHNPFQMPTLFRFQQRSVITVHDIIPFLHPEVHTAKTVLSQRALLPRSLMSADRIIAISQNTKRDLVRLMRVPEDKVEVIHPAYSPSLKRAGEEETEAFLKAQGITPPYFLYVGTMEPRKNVGGILRALSILRKQGREARLVLVGKKGWHYDSIFADIDALGLASSVRYLGHVDEAGLSCLYSGATAFVYPSLYEGFGLPPVEAMVCGTPAIVSDVSSLPEAVGDAGLQVDPGSADALAEAMRSMLEDERLRQELVGKGLSWSTRFTAERLAEETLRLYQRL